jgi:hypothetical protein
VSALNKDFRCVIIGTGRKAEKNDIPVAREFTRPPFVLKLKNQRYLHRTRTENFWEL